MSKSLGKFRVYYAGDSGEELIFPWNINNILLKVTDAKNMHSNGNI